MLRNFNLIFAEASSADNEKIEMQEQLRQQARRADTLVARDIVDLRMPSPIGATFFN